MFTEWFSTATTQAQTFITLALDYDKSVLSLKHPKYHQLNHLKISLWDRTPLPLPHSQQTCSKHRSHFRFHCQQTQSRPPSLGFNVLHNPVQTGFPEPPSHYIPAQTDSSSSVLQAFPSSLLCSHLPSCPPTINSMSLLFCGCVLFWVLSLLWSSK